MCRLIFAVPRTANDNLFLYTLTEVSGLDGQINGWGVCSAHSVYRTTSSISNDINVYQQIISLPFGQVATIHIRQASNVFFSKELDAIHPFEINQNTYIVHNGVFADYRRVGSLHKVQTHISDTHTMAAVLKSIAQQHSNIPLPEVLQKWVDTFHPESKYAIGVHKVDENIVYIFRNKTRSLFWAVIDNTFIVVHTLKENIKAAAEMHKRKITKQGEIEEDTLYVLSDRGLQQLNPIKSRIDAKQYVTMYGTHQSSHHITYPPATHASYTSGTYTSGITNETTEYQIIEKLQKMGFFITASTELAAYIKSGMQGIFIRITNVEKSKIDEFYKTLRKLIKGHVTQEHISVQVEVIRNAVTACVSRKIQEGLNTVDLSEVLQEMISMLNNYSKSH